MSILHFRKQFVTPPVAIEVPGIHVRTFVAPEDIEPWLALHSCATADLSPPVRAWSPGEFRHEMLDKSWWRSDHAWLAIAGDPCVAGDRVQNQASGERSSPAIARAEAHHIVGAVTLAFREGAEATVPVVHWLLVDRTWQRRGIARMLMSHLETAAWHAGYREIELETHANWNAAVAFYQSIGYAPLRERSPR